jgi:outer membrane protein OmpA-like peptidoglycan-associated protein
MQRLSKGIGYALLLIFAGSALAQQTREINDKPGGEDHEVVGRYAGSVLINYGQQEYAEIAAPLGPMLMDRRLGRYMPDKSLKVGGKLFNYLYRAPTQGSSLAIYRNYEQALKAKGFNILYVCDEPKQCRQQNLQEYADQWTRAPTTFVGGYSPGSVMDGNAGGGNYPPRYLVASREIPEGNLYVTLTVEDYGASSLYYLQVLEAKKMQMDAVQILDAKAIGSELTSVGKVSLYGIEFDTNSATIRADSLPQVQQMADVLKAQSQLKVFIVGHTDNVGAYEQNRTLSQRRAQSVLDALSNAGIDKGRMQAVGVANVAPVVSNGNDAGRARNRRVEMVVQ